MRPDNKVLKTLEKYLVITNISLFTFPSVKPTVAIDYILFNKKAFEKFNVGKFYTVDEKYASDHLPLVTDLTLK